MDDDRESDFAIADEDPDGYWYKFTKRLQMYEKEWTNKGFDEYIEHCMKEKKCVPWFAFVSVLDDLYTSAKKLHDGDVIRAVYHRMREKRCTKICHVMERALLDCISMK